MTNTISVIVPVYNAEKYLRRCLDSICGQTYKHLEIILINDGSSDNSQAICEEYLKKDSRIKLFNQENGGSSIARNTGLDNATGAFIAFVDSDDHIKPTMYQEMLELLVKHDLDVVEVERNASDPNVVFDSSFSIEDPITAFKRVIKTTSFQVWKRLFKRNLIGDMRFIPKIIHQDAYLIVDILNKVSKVGFLNSDLYVYNRDSIGIVRSKYTAVKRDDGIRVMEYIKEHVPGNSEVRQVLNDHIVSYYTDHFWKLSQNTALDKDLAFRKRLKKEITKAANWSNIGLLSSMVILLPIRLISFLFLIRNRLKSN